MRNAAQQFRLVIETLQGVGICRQFLFENFHCHDGTIGRRSFPHIARRAVLNQLIEQVISSPVLAGRGRVAR